MSLKPVSDDERKQWAETRGLDCWDDRFREIDKSQFIDRLIADLERVDKEHGIEHSMVDLWMVTVCRSRPFRWDKGYEPNVAEAFHAIEEQAQKGAADDNKDAKAG